MQAFRMHGVGRGSLESLEDPAPAQDEIIVEPVMSGLCSTDTHIFFEGVLVKELPVTMGHETVGTVADLGHGQPWKPYSADDRPLEVGDLVCVEPLLPCNTCFECVRGRPNLCRDMSHLGIWRDGCWADYVAVPRLRAVPVANGLLPEQAIFVEPLACALHFLDRAGAGPGKSALILGAGPAGLLTLQAAKAAGIQPVIVSEPASARRTIARRLGADLVLDPTEHELATVVEEATNGLGADLVIELTGSPAAVTEAIDVARSGSTVVLAGICGADRTPVDTNAIVTKELNVVGALASRWHFDRSMKLIASGTIEVESLVSRRAPWKQAAEQLRSAHTDLQMVKILLDHDSGPGVVPV